MVNCVSGASRPQQIQGKGEEGHSKIIMHLLWAKYQIIVTLKSLGETTVDLKLAFLNRLV